MKTGFHAFIIKRNKAIVDSRLGSLCEIAPLSRVYFKEVIGLHNTPVSLPFNPLPFPPIRSSPLPSLSRPLKSR